MRYSKPILQSTYKRLYDPIRGRRVLDEHKGFFKNTARRLGISGLVGLDPLHETGLFVSKPLESMQDAHGHLSNFLSHYQGVEQDAIFMQNDKNGKPYLQIGHGPLAKHSVTKRGKDYFIQTNNNGLWKTTLPLRIVANNDQEMTSKLAKILNSPVARAKLTLKTPVIPLLNKDILAPGHGTYVMLNDSKIIPNSYQQQFETTDAFAMDGDFDSALGDVSGAQIHYNITDTYAGPYSDLPQDKPYEEVKDEAWLRVHAMTEHILSSNITDHLLGNIVNMYDTKKRMTPKQRSQTIEKMRQDFVYNLHGKGSTNTRQRDESPAAFDYDVTDNSIWKQFELTGNAFRGGRMLRDIPFSLEQSVRAFYKSDADGKRIFKYDVDPEKFKSLVKKMAIKPADRQFMAAHGRKILGVYIALKFLADEMAVMEKNDPLAVNQKKWADLHALQDILFESAGDSRNFIRQNTSSFAQLKDCVKKPIPKISDNEYMIHLRRISDNKDGFVQQSTKNLYDHFKDYTYMEDLFGWHARERIGSWIYKDIISKVFDKAVPKVRGATAAIILLEGIDNVSRELKEIENNFQMVVDGKTAFNNMVEKFKYGDLKGVEAFLKWNVNRLTNGFTEEKNNPEYKSQRLQAEGVIMEDQYLAPPKRKYLGENQGFFFGNAPTSRTSWLYADIVKQDMVELMQLFAIHIKKIQSEMKHNNVADMYHTGALKNLNALLRKSADSMADNYMQEKQAIFQKLSPEDHEKLTFEISKKMYCFLQNAVNVCALLANAPDVVYK